MAVAANTPRRHSCPTKSLGHKELNKKYVRCTMQPGSKHSAAPLPAVHWECSYRQHMRQRPVLSYRKTNNGRTGTQALSGLPLGERPLSDSNHGEQKKSFLWWGALAAVLLPLLFFRSCTPSPFDFFILPTDWRVTGHRKEKDSSQEREDRHALANDSGKHSFL